MTKEKMEIEFSAIPSEHVLYVWPKVAPLFDKLITKQGHSSLEEIYKNIGINKTHLLWIGWEKNNIDNIVVCLLTNIQHDMLIISACAGINMKDWVFKVLSILDNFANDSKCKKMHIRSGRKGWAKSLQEYGMKITAYTFEKKI